MASMTAAVSILRVINTYVQKFTTSADFNRQSIFFLDSCIGENIDPLCATGVHRPCFKIF
jgi:hypothetical protein